MAILLWYGLAVNLVLTLFSLIPFPPFSGGVALFSLLPQAAKPIEKFFAQYGVILGLLFVYFVGARYILVPALNFVLRSII